MEMSSASLVITKTSYKGGSIMKKISAVVASVVFLVAVLILSIAVSAANKKDPNCINRCNVDYTSCMKVAKNNNPNIIDRMASEDECLRVKRTCYGLCSERLQ